MAVVLVEGGCPLHLLAQFAKALWERGAIDSRTQELVDGAGAVLHSRR